MVQPRYAGIWRRYLAAWLDLGVVAVAFFFLGVTGIAATWSEDTLNGLWVLSLLMYFVGLEAGFGATLGKRLLGMRVVDDAGDDIDVGKALGRNLLRVVDGFAFGIVGLVTAKNSPTRQRLGDRAAGTVVIRA